MPYCKILVTNVLNVAKEKENMNTTWKTIDIPAENFENFLRNGLKIENPDEIELVDVHRPPQHPFKNMKENFTRRL